MAKGFTVKAKNPVKKKQEPEWDIDAIKARMRGKTIVFCLPGKQNTIFLPFILALIASISHSGSLAFLGGTVLTVNPFAIAFCNYTSIILDCMYNVNMNLLPT